jgi:predicted DNA-binding transcriptional regulator YafY
MADTLYRQWLLLSHLPRAPMRMSVEALDATLRTHGIETTLRTLQRDLVALSRIFPLESDDKKPAGWRWCKDAETTLMPGMDPQTALAFRIVEQHVSHLLPRASLKLLAPHFEHARNTLGRLKGPGPGSWLDRVRVIPRAMQLLPPVTKPAVVDVVYDSVFGNRAFECTYRGRGQSTDRALVLHPVGLVFKDSVAILLAMAFDYSDIRQYALHRFASASMLDDVPARTVKGFNIDRHIEDGELGFLLSKKPKKLRALFSPEAAPSVVETPLSKDQKVTVRKDGWVLVEATVPDTVQLRAFLDGFGHDKCQRL